MNEEQLSVMKNPGGLEPFSLQKLKKSLQKCGATNKETKNITYTIEPHIHDGISSNEIYIMQLPN